ncbi:MAG: hypothetical protein IKJ32_00340 [Clostridia bacterium]|nr:hypothetical protein [Clostridia bacterium]
MKNKILKIIGAISAFFLSVLGLTGCRGNMQALYGVPPGIQQDLYGVPAPTQKYEQEEIDEKIKESLESSMSEEVDPTSEL